MRGWLGAVFAGAMLGLSACGDHQEAAGAGEAKPDPAGLSRAAAMINRFRAKPTFVPPGAPFDARACAKGRSMVSIPNNSANPFLKGLIHRMTAIGDSVGLKVREWQNQGQPSDWAQGVDYAVRSKPTSST